jgi:hypothetical protein
VVVCVLAVPGMIQVSGVPVGVAFGAGGTAAALLAGVAGGLIATLRRPLGWVARVGGASWPCIALGLLTPVDVGRWAAAFAALFAVEFVLGTPKIDGRPGLPLG